jgi:type II secretory pathway pseudopilin PulG
MRQFIASRLRNARGFSVVELTTVLAAVTALSGMAAPAINNYLEEAKLVRARSDVRVIATSLVRMMNDVGAQSRRSAGWAQYDLLTSAGEAPIAATTAASPWSAGDRVGRLDDHLVDNQAGYASPEGRGLTGYEEC